MNQLGFDFRSWVPKKTVHLCFKVHLYTVQPLLVEERKRDQEVDGVKCKAQHIEQHIKSVHKLVLGRQAKRKKKSEQREKKEKK